MIGQGTFGAVFLTKFQAEEKPAENSIVKKLLSTAQDFTATFTKEAKTLKAVCEDPMAMMLEYVYFARDLWG